MARMQLKGEGEARRFLEKLDSENAFTFQTFDDTERKEKSLTRVLHGSFEKHCPTLEKLNDRGAGIFVTVNETNLNGRKADNIVRIRAVFADLDDAPLKPVREFGLRPHIIIETSPNRWHAYWLTKELPLDEFTNIQKIIASRFRSDPAITDRSRVMRLPGFYHCKGEPFLVRIEHLTDLEPYKADEIRHWFGGTNVQHQPICGPQTHKQVAGRNVHLFSMACTVLPPYICAT